MHVRNLRIEVVRDNQTFRRQTSDFRLTLRREMYRPLTTGSMVPGNFSTPLRSARNDRRERFEI